jgi:hypothetical protein
MRAAPRYRVSGVEIRIKHFGVRLRHRPRSSEDNKRLQARLEAKKARPAKAALRIFSLPTAPFAAAPQRRPGGSTVMSTNYSSGTQTATLVIAPIAARAAWYTARHQGRLSCCSRTPLLDGARELLASGFSAHTVIELRHAGSDAVAMRAVLGVAASLTVTANRTGRPVFRCQKATESDAAAPPVRPSKLAAGRALEAAQ